MRIGIDLDGTITNFNEFIINKFKDSYKVKNLKGYALNEVFDLTQEELNDLNEIIRTKVRMEVPPRENAKTIIDDLKCKGCEIYIITSRKESDLINPYDNTVKWLNDNKINYDKLILGNSNKLEECINNKIDIFIDDKIKHVKACSEYGITSFIFNNKYNQDNDLNVVKSFDELYLKINDIIENA